MDLYIDKAHTALDIFRFAAFLQLELVWTQHFFGPKMHLRMEFDSGVAPTCLF